MSEQLSVAKDIEALALINIQDIFRFTITATDEEIEDRYGSEARAIEVAEKYLEIAMRTSVLEYDLKGWSVTYSVPIKDKNERIEKTAYFYDKADRKTENSSEIPNNCEESEQRKTCKGISCKHWRKDAWCEECHYEPKDEPTISKMEQVETMSCAECKHRPIGAEICEEPCHYEPQTDWHYDEQDATWYPYKHEDEPQIKGSKRLLKGKDEQSGKE